MNKRMEEALFGMYQVLEEQEETQKKRGHHDQGRRSMTTGGHHLDLVAAAIVEDLVDCGFNEDDVYYQSSATNGSSNPKSLTLPGWFRPTKDWDLIALDNDSLVSVVELKSINSSFGNNCNNRCEESIGSGIDISYAIKNDLVPYQSRPPLIGYVMVVRYCDKSIKPVGGKKKSLYPTDSAFDNASYFERLTVLCRRLLGERIYQAVWIVGVDVDNHKIFEPDSELTYAKFLTAITSELNISRA